MGSAAPAAASSVSGAGREGGRDRERPAPGDTQARHAATFCHIARQPGVVETWDQHHSIENFTGYIIISMRSKKNI